VEIASLPDATWNFEEKTSKKFTRNFRSGLCLCYQVSEEESAIDVPVALPKTTLASSDGQDDDSDWSSDDDPGGCEWDSYELTGKYKWPRKEFEEADDPELFVYHLL